MEVWREKRPRVAAMTVWKRDGKKEGTGSMGRSKSSNGTGWAFATLLVT